MNPYINAVIEERFQQALAEAELCDAALEAGKVTAADLEKEKPLYGVPISVKESCSVKGKILRLEAKAVLLPFGSSSVEQLFVFQV